MLRMASRYSRSASVAFGVCLALLLGSDIFGSNDGTGIQLPGATPVWSRHGSDVVSAKAGVEVGAGSGVLSESAAFASLATRLSIFCSTCAILLASISDENSVMVSMTYEGARNFTARRCILAHTHSFPAAKHLADSQCSLHKAVAVGWASALLTG